MIKMQSFKTKKRVGSGFTLIEVLVVITIIAILVAVMFPVTARVRQHARVVNTQSNINILDVGVEKFYNDMGSYPSSEPRAAIDFLGINQPGVVVDIGAHRLVEALVGIDLLGYSTTQDYEYDPVALEPLTERQGVYVDVKNDNLSVMLPRAMMDDRYDETYTFDDLNISAPEIRSNLNPMFIDASGGPEGCRPILYYKANKREAKIGTIYNANDNALITEGGTKYPSLVSYAAVAKDWGNTSLYELGGFEGYIWDPTTSFVSGDPLQGLQDLSARPYNKDTFLLIAAGPDGIYGTEDDICNFQRK